MKATLRNYRQAPRKARKVADLVRGKEVEAALVQLKFLTKKGALPIAKLIAGAAANARENFKITTPLVISEIRVDKALTYKRFLPAPHGSAHPMHKHASHIIITLSPAVEKKPKVRRALKAKAAKKEKEN